MLYARYVLPLSLCLLCVSPALSAASTPSARKNGAAHEQAIRKINETWLALIRNRDAAAVSTLYTSDGAMMAPGAPIAKGQPALEQAWRGLMKLPGFGLTFKAEQIVVASGGDMALDRGTYELSLEGPKGPTKDSGKYVVVWRNVGGHWKVAADIFNSDGTVAR